MNDLHEEGNKLIGELLINPDEFDRKYKANRIDYYDPEAPGIYLIPVSKFDSLIIEKESFSIIQNNHLDIVAKNYKKVEEIIKNH